MKQRRRCIFCIMLAVVILTALQPTLSAPVSAEGSAAPAAEGLNSYGHRVAYTPQPLNAGGKELMFFDYGMAHYAKINNMSTSQQLNYLNNNKLSLNKFGAYHSSYGVINAAKPFNGAIYNRDSDKDFKVFYDFRSILVGQTHGSKEGNLKTMFEKGDLSFALAYRVWLRYYDKNKVFSKENLSSIAEVNMFGENKRWTGTNGNRWERVNYTSSDKLNLSGGSTWKGWGGNNLFMSYYGSSYGGPVDTDMENGVLVGKDSKGPRIKTVNLSWDIDGPWEYQPNGTMNSGWQGIDTIMDDDIGKTVYIAVMFDEPVKFNQQFDTPQELANLKLTVQTHGRDGSSAMPLEADFLKYAPDANASAPVMIFEYKIQDPKDESSIRKDLYYTFTSVKVTSTENNNIYNCLTDMAGNAFGEQGGLQPNNYSVLVKNRKWDVENRKWVQKSTVADLEPLIIESATIAHNNTLAEYLTKYEYVSINLNFNKTLAWEGDAPTITLNIKDDSGQYIVPSFYHRINSKKSTNSPESTSLTYVYYLGWGNNLSAEGPIRIQSISTEGKTVRDESGYSLTIPKTMPALDKNYYLDFDEPVINVHITKVESAENIFKITANVEDASLRGRDAAFSIYTDLDSTDPLQYQISSDGSYGYDWNSVSGKSFSVNAPLMPPNVGNEKNAYAFVKLPDNGAQATRLYADVRVTDTAGNMGKGSANLKFVPYFDTRDPEVELVRQFKKDRFSIMLYARDFSAMTYRYAWLGEHDAEYPSAWTEGGPITGNKLLEYLYADNGMTGNEIYGRTLWVEVEDESGNTTAQNTNFTYDNRYSEIYADEVIPEGTGAIIKEENLSASVSFKNVTEYAHAWIEWGPEFENDGGAFFKNSAAIFYDQSEGNVFRAEGAKTVLESTTSAAATFALNNDTPVWRNYDSDGGGYSYGWDRAGQASPGEISGPIVLVICGIYKDGDEDRYTFEFIPFNTRYGIGNYEVQQVRFSTNGADGKRIDRVYEKATDFSNSPNLSYGYGLYYPEKPGTDVSNAVNLSLATGAVGVNPTALNFTPLNDFAEAEFVLRDDPALGLESLKLTGGADGTKVLLKKVTFQSDGSMEHLMTDDPDAGYDYSFWFKDEIVKSEEVLEAWYLTEEILTLAEENSRLGPSKRKLVNQDAQYLLDYSFTLPIDVSLITPNAYDEAGNLIRYEFWIEYAYQDHYNSLSKSEILTMFAFENRLPELLFGSVMIDDKEFGESHRAVPANLATDGEGDDIQIIENTVSAHRVFFSGDDPKLMLKADMPDNAFNMLNNYSISVESVSDTPGIINDPITITPGHDYRVLYSTADGLDTDGQSIVINGRFAECEGGSFIIDPRDLVEGEGGTLADGETLTVYYQLVKEDINKVAGEFPGQFTYQLIKRYSPVYRIDLVRDEIPPVISLNVSETEVTNNDVTVIIQSVRDGRMVNEGLDEYYIMDTPAEEIRIVVLAKHEDGEIIQIENGAYIFNRNGSIEVTAVDKAGNEAIERYEVNNIEREPPVVTGSPVINSENGSFTINATITGGDAVDAYISFDAEYAAHLLGEADDDATPPVVTAALLSEDPDIENRFPVKGSEIYGIVMNKGISGGEDDSLELSVYAKSGVPMSSAILHVTDVAGNVGELPLAVYINGIVPTVTNIDKIYSYAGALTFSVPVRLIDPVGIGTGYALSHEKLPIYTDGPVIVSYTDIFGRSYYEQITADIFGSAYAHELNITPSGPTNGSITVKVDTSGYNTIVLGGEDENHRTIIMSDNGDATYTIVPDGAMAPKEFSIPINNIDKTPPKAFYTRTVNGEESFDAAGNSTVTGSVTYTILGFDENNVAMDEGEAITVTFTSAGEHTFRFTDAAGNRGELTVSEAETFFQMPVDLGIVKFRLTYTMSGEGTAHAQLGYHNSDEAAPVLMTTNQNISVLVQALNAAGDVIPAEMERPAVPAEGVQYFTEQSTIIFSKGGTTSVNLTTASDSKKSITITIPEGTIDKIPPKGSVDYVMLTGDEILPGGITFEKGTVKAYLVTGEQNIEVNGMNVRQDSDGKYYIHFAENGNGRFYLTDKAGNTGTVMAGAYSIDNTPPGIKTESWYSGIAAKPGADDGTSGNSNADVLSTLTNNSIRLFFVFNELLRNVDIVVFSADGDSRIPSEDMGSYINYTHSANTLNIEFKQNCRAMITVFDIRGNETTLWRPEDGPLDVIDKDAPAYTAGTPVVQDNKVSISYSFDEEVASANAKGEYKSVHSITFEKNGVYSLTFVDRAGNVVTINTKMDQIDDQSPTIFYAMKIVPESAGIIYSDEAKTQPAATSGNVEIAIVAEDENGAAIQVVNQNKPGSPLALVEPTINAGAEKTYTHALVVEENGVYRITASDDFGNTNIVFVRISFIDKTAPSILLESSKALSAAVGTEADELSRMLLEGVSAKDDREGDVTSKVTVDVSTVDLDEEGVYTAIYRVKDGLDNTAAKSRKVSVSGSAMHPLLIEGKQVAANDVYITMPGSIAISVPAGYTCYASEGYKTRAQMKYAPSLSGKLEATNKGYYTILLQNGDRDAFIVYVYVYVY